MPKLYYYQKKVNQRFSQLLVKQQIVHPMMQNTNYFLKNHRKNEENSKFADFKIFAMLSRKCMLQGKR